MQIKKKFSCILLLLAIFSNIIPNVNGDAGAAISLITSELLKLFRSGDFEFLGYPCHHRIRPKVRRWKLKYEGKVWCPGWASFSGRSLKSSRSGAVEHAIKDFANQAVRSKLVSEKAVQQWAQRHAG